MEQLKINELLGAFRNKAPFHRGVIDANVEEIEGAFGIWVAEPGNSEPACVLIGTSRTDVNAKLIEHLDGGSNEQLAALLEASEESFFSYSHPRPGEELAEIVEVLRANYEPRLGWALD